MKLRLTVNGASHELDIDGETPLLWILRDHLKLTGTKYGCGKASCGACTVHLNGQAVRSCSMPAAAIDGARVRTIEGIDPARFDPLLAAWTGEQVPQCGYCQPGMLMAAAALLERKPNPTDADIDENITNLCRCGTYNRVRRAIHAAADQIRQAKQRG
jgi:isoquinoline 1-oxidoreductase alpha subunit